MSIPLIYRLFFRVLGAAVQELDCFLHAVPLSLYFYLYKASKDGFIAVYTKNCCLWYNLSGCVSRRAWAAG